MFLMSDRLIRLYMSRRLIQISNMHDDSLVSTSYYFHLGGHADVYGARGERTINIERNGLTLDPGERASVLSEETFLLSEQVMALLGNRSNNPVEKGVFLLNGPVIDPGYRAPIKVGLMNISTDAVHLDYRDEIGKVIFFEVSDTALEESRFAPDVARRQSDLNPE
jgi:dUTPase